MIDVVLFVFCSTKCISDLFCLSVSYWQLGSGVGVTFTCFFMFEIPRLERFIAKSGDIFLLFSMYLASL